MKKILFAASECVPFVKTGGLADVVGSLPQSFPKDKYDVRVILPNYMCIPEKYRNEFKYVTHFYMDLGKIPEKLYVGILEYQFDGIHYYFIDNIHYFQGSGPYFDISADIEKFSYFSKAVLSALPLIDFQPDVIHCHDWQSALIPVYLHTLFTDNNFYSKTKTVMTIHNLRFQGTQNKGHLQYYTGLPDYVFRGDRMATMDSTGKYMDGNMLKAGMVYSTYITTVSDTYAAEIQTSYYGETLDETLRTHSNKLKGIVNGIDYNEYNPETDSKIPYNFSAQTFRRDKIKNKQALQRELGLDQDHRRMMIGMVSRLSDQKGFDLVEYVMDSLCQDFVQIVVLGTGDTRYENMFKHFAWKYKGRVSANIYYSDDMAHKIYASSDAFLMPSQFEPCGLSQLISLRYGTIPIVRETGGLKDTVEPYNEFNQTGTGFSFTNYNADEMLNTIRYAEKIFFDKKADWNKIVDRAMAKDFSWNTSAIKYMELYDSITG